MSQYGNIGQLNIVITANANATINSLDRLSKCMANLTFGDVKGLKDFTKGLKALANIDLSNLSKLDTSSVSKQINDLTSSITEVNFKTKPLLDIANAIKVLSNVDTSKEFSFDKIVEGLKAFDGLSLNIEGTEGITQLTKSLSSKNIDKAINNMPILADAMTILFNRLSTAPMIRQDVIDMTKALADFTTNGGKVGSASRKIANGMDKMGKSAKKNKGLIAQFFAGFNAGNFAGNFTANLITPVIRGIASAFSEAINNSLEYASSLVETQNVLERTFGNSIDVVEDFSKTALKMYGMNELESKKMIGTFQAMGTALGETKDRMADVSTSMGALVGDYASFFNMNVADVANDFTAIFTGQTKAMRKYGIDLTNAQLQDFADSQGWNVQVKSLNQYNKAIIRYNYLVSRSQDILGDFQRTQMSYANQTKLLSQQFKELFGTLGQIGIAILTPILQVMNELISKIRQFAEQLVAFLGIDNFASISGGAVEGLEDIADGFDDVAEAEKKAKTYSTGIDELNVLKPNESANKGGAGELGAGWDTDWWDKIKKGKKDITDFTELLEHLKWVFTPLKEAFATLWEEGIKPFVETAKAGISDLWHNHLENFVHWLLRDLFPIIVNIFTNIAQHLTNILSEVFKLFDLFFTQIANSGWAKAIELLFKNVVAPIVDFIGEIATRAIQLFEPVRAFVGGAVAWIGNVVKGILQEIDLSVILNPLKEIAGIIVEQLQKSGLTDKIVKMWETLKPMGEALGSVIGKALQFIFTILGEIFTALKPIIDFLSSVIFKTLGAVIDGIAFGLSKLEPILKAIADFIGKIIDTISGAGSWVADKISGLINFFTGGNKDTEVNVEVKANTEEVQSQLDNIGTDKEIEVKAKVDSEQVSTATAEAITLASASESTKIEIRPEIRTESVAQAFEELNANIQTQGEKLNDSMSQIGTTANTTLNTTFTNNNATLIEIITENANTIKTTFEDAKIGLGIKGNTSTVFEEYGLAVVNGFKAGIEKNKQISINAVSVWVKDIMRTFVGNDVEGINYNVWFEYAHQVMLGFAEGITHWSYLAMEAIRKWVAEMMAEFEEDMEIESPSKVFKGYGYYTVAGFNEGIKNNTSTTTSIIKDWVGDIEKQMQAIENFNIDMSNTIKGLDNLTAKVNTQVDMSGFYDELEKASTMGMTTSLNNYAESRQAIEVNIPNITLEVDSREIARANYKGQRELGYQIKK